MVPSPQLPAITRSLLTPALMVIGLARVEGVDETQLKRPRHAGGASRKNARVSVAPEWQRRER